nr:MAG TPA: hypothetical protein [Caudoviricetes sp.]
MIVNIAIHLIPLAKLATKSRICKLPFYHAILSTNNSYLIFYQVFTILNFVFLSPILH